MRPATAFIRLRPLGGTRAEGDPKTSLQAVDPDRVDEGPGGAGLARRRGARARDRRSVLVRSSAEPLVGRGRAGDGLAAPWCLHWFPGCHHLPAPRREGLRECCDAASIAELKMHAVLWLHTCADRCAPLSAIRGSLPAAARPYRPLLYTVRLRQVKLNSDYSGSAANFFPPSPACWSLDTRRTVTCTSVSIQQIPCCNVHLASRVNQ